MKDKEVKCSCKVVYSKILLVTGIIGGVLLAILGIVTITADTKDLFASTFFQWYTTDYRTIRFKEGKAFSTNEFWARPNQILYFEWDTNNPVVVFETDSSYRRPLAGGVKTEFKKNGREYIPMDNFTITSHYFCMSQDQVYCVNNHNYFLHVHMYKDSYFYSNGYLGNQNMRWTFFLLACLIVIFGVIMILGELHVPLVTTKFTFFYYSFVKGMIYLSIGFLVMGMSNLLGLVIAIYMWIIGILNCIYGWRSVATFQWNKVGARGTTTIVTRREYI